MIPTIPWVGTGPWVIEDETISGNNMAELMIVAEEFTK